MFSDWSIFLIAYLYKTGSDCTIPLQISSNCAGIFTVLSKMSMNSRKYFEKIIYPLTISFHIQPVDTIRTEW